MDTIDNSPTEKSDSGNQKGPSNASHTWYTKCLEVLQSFASQISRFFRWVQINFFKGDQATDKPTQT